MMRTEQKRISRSRADANFPEADHEASTLGTRSSAVNFFDTQRHLKFENSGSQQSKAFGKIQRKKDKEPKTHASSVAKRSTTEQAQKLIDDFRNGKSANSTKPVPAESKKFPGAKRDDIADTLEKNISGDMATCNQGDSNLCGVITPQKAFLIDLDPAGYVQMVIDLYVNGKAAYSKDGKHKKMLRPGPRLRHRAAQLNQQEGDKIDYAGADDEVLIVDTDPANPGTKRTKDKQGNYPMLEETPLNPEEQIIYHKTKQDPAHPDAPYLQDADAMFNIAMLQKYGMRGKRLFSGFRLYSAGKENSDVWGGSGIGSMKRMLKDFYGIEPYMEFGGISRGKLHKDDFVKVMNQAKDGFQVLMLVNSDYLRDETGKIVTADKVKSRFYDQKLKDKLKAIDENKMLSKLDREIMKEQLLSSTQLVKPMKEGVKGVIKDLVGTHWIQVFSPDGSILYYWEYSAEKELPVDMNNDESIDHFLECAAGALVMPKIEPPATK